MTVMGNMRQFFRVTPKNGRRGFLKRMAAAPLAGRMAADEAAKALAGIGGGCGFPVESVRDVLRELPDNCCPPPSNPPASQGTDWRIVRKLRDDLIRKALDTPKSRAELEAVLYKMYRQVYLLDIDLATNRSMSIAAKVAFQRQRNVASEIESSIRDRSTRESMMDWKRKILSVAGIDWH